MDSQIEEINRNIIKELIKEMSDNKIANTTQNQVKILLENQGLVTEVIKENFGNNLEVLKSLILKIHQIPLNDTIFKLIEDYAELKEFLISFKDIEGSSMLIIASKLKNLPLVNKLIELGADIKVVNKFKENALCCLLGPNEREDARFNCTYPIKYSKEELNATVIKLMNHDTVNQATEDNVTSLIVAIYTQNLPIVKEHLKPEYKTKVDDKIKSLAASMMFENKIAEFTHHSSSNLPPIGCLDSESDSYLIAKAVRLSGATSEDSSND